MRIIAGSRRGAILTKLDAVKTRPTADRVRESLFNILQAGRFQGLLADSQVIDVFAGTGALGLEAISRGAALPALLKMTRPPLRFCGRILPSFGFNPQLPFWPLMQQIWCIGGRHQPILFLPMHPIKPGAAFWRLTLWPKLARLVMRRWLSSKPQKPKYWIATLWPLA